MAKDTNANGADASADVTRSYIVVPMPQSLKSVFESEAKAADKPLGPFVRDWIAAQRGIELPAAVTTRRSKYGSEEERKAAQKERNKSRNDLIKQLLAEHKAKAGVTA